MGYATLVARIFLAIPFLVVGFEKITNFGSTVDVVASTGLPLPAIATVIAILFEFGGAILLLLGYQARLGAWMLAAFTAAATILYHRDIGQPIQMMMALKNIAIMGGLLLVAFYGSGKYSLRLKGDKEGKS